MKNTILIIDGGTTNTRFTLMRGSEVLTRRTVRIGAANANAAHRNQGLRDAVSATCAELKQVFQTEIDRVCISGMITSESGLYAIPHLQAPAGLRELSAGMQTIELPDVLEQPIVCIPGIRTVAEDGSRDMMRGEEVEIMGDLAAHPTDGIRLYLHFGSHNKAILVKNGRICMSATAMSGELLAAALQHTILASSVDPQADYTPDEAFLRRGFATAARKGLPGALFGGRLCAVLEGADSAQVLSYLYGAFAQQDVCCFRELLDQQPEEIVFYGRDAFITAWQCCMGDTLRQTRLRVIPYADSEWLSVYGAQAVLAQAQKEEKGHE